MRIDTFEQERQRRVRGEAELEAILQAKKETERIQAEMFARSTNDSSASGPDAESSELPSRSRHKRTVGQKRKSIHVGGTENSDGRDASRKIAKGHDRSRTMGQTEDLFDPSRSAAGQFSATTPNAQSRSSIYSGRSVLNGPGASKDLRRSLSGRKDTTRTDYFRLKALGIDPDTPIIPDTKASLERKRQREHETAIAITKTRTRTSSSTERPPVPQISPQGASPRATSSLNHSPGPPKANSRTTSSAAPQLDDDDDLLQEVRKVRHAITEDTEWFKIQAVNFEKEIEEQEELRRSASQASSRSSPHPSASGLARANGYDFLPGPGIPGRILSRTEQRIRRTGAHGLATKPIGGSGGYLAVAMSRDSAAKLNVERQSQHAPEPLHRTEKIRKRKRKVGEKDGRFVPQESDEDSEEFENDAESNGLHRRSERRMNGKVRATEANHHHLQPDEESAEEHDDAEQEDDDDVQESLEQPQYKEYDQLEDGDTEDLYEDGDDEKEQYDDDQEGAEGDDEVEEEADEVGSLAHQHGQKAHGQTSGYWLRSSATPERGLTPNGGQMMSRASSGMGTGTGASADDALVLDSD